MLCLICHDCGFCGGAKVTGCRTFEETVFYEPLLQGDDVRIRLADLVHVDIEIAVEMLLQACIRGCMDKVIFYSTNFK